jgi:hypothetical protein
MQSARWLDLLLCREEEMWLIFLMAAHFDMPSTACHGVGLIRDAQDC